LFGEVDFGDGHFARLVKAVASVFADAPNSPEMRRRKLSLNARMLTNKFL
jgi:hypothetical protein